MSGRNVILAVSGSCLLGWGALLGTSVLVCQAGPEYIVGTGSGGQDMHLGISRVLRENVGAPEDEKNLAICQAASAVNIRQQANTASAVVGKIHRNAAAYIIATVDGEGGNWYQIQSGTVSGFVKASYFLTGAQAQAAAKEVGICYATIHTAALRLREKPDVSSQTLTTLRQGAEYIMLGEENHFAKLAVDDTLTGYVSMDYIKTRMVYPQAVSLAEEAAQQAEEARRQQEAQEAFKKLEEVKLVEAKNDIGMENPLAPVQVIPGVQETSLAPVQAIPGAQEAEPATIAANPLGQGQGEHPQAEAPGTAPTLAGITIVNSAGPGSPANQANTDTSSFYGPGGNASSEVVSATRTALVAYAKQFLGYPYVYGGDSLTNGTDCSGFVMRVFEHFGIATGRNSREQAGKGMQIAIEAVKPGDLLFYASGDTINHVAIYIGAGQVIHAASARTGIIISPSDYRTPCRAVSFFD